MVENVKYALNVAHHSPSRSRKLQHLVNEATENVRSSENEPQADLNG